MASDLLDVGRLTSAFDRNVSTISARSHEYTYAALVFHQAR
jgi:hypothetical protein